MKDQAEGLRVLAQSAGKKSGKASQLRARAIAVTSGKGGVGKTNLTINLAIEAARRGKKVLVVDADWGLANIDVVLGVNPELNVSHFVSGEATLEEIMYEGPEGIMLVPNGSGLTELANVSQVKQKRIFSALAQLEEEYDVVLLDTGAGISDKVLNFVYSAGEAIVVVTPEPTSIRDAYAVIKTVTKKSPRSRLGILVNMAGDNEEGRDVGQRISDVAEQFLGRRIEVLGHVRDDKALSQSVREQIPVVIRSPKSDSARDVAVLADKLFGARVHENGFPDGEEIGFFARVARLFGG